MSSTKQFTNNKSLKNQVKMPVQEFEPNIPVVIPARILDQIQYLCYKISKVEWSGILFYSFEGSIVEPDTFKITIEDILPMDKGSSAYTEYELDGRYIDYLMDNPEAMDWKIGHIHSHNTMDVFFSHTDMAELNDNSPNHNVYLSLIVNNFNEFCAKVCYMATTKTKEIEVKYSAMDSDGEEYTIGIIPTKVIEKLLCVHDCDIIVNDVKPTAEEGFMAKVANLLKPKVVKKQFSNTKGKTWNKSTGKWDIPVKQLETNPLSDDALSDNIFKDVDLGTFTSNNPLDNPNLNEDRSEAEIFIMTLLNFTNEPNATDDIDTIITELEELQVTSFDLAQSVSANFSGVYERMFTDNINTEHLYKILDESIEELELFQDMYPLINDTIAQLYLIKGQFEAAQEQIEE